MTKPRIYMGDNHASWDENGWVWFMAARAEEYCAIRITPAELVRLRAATHTFAELVAAIEAAAAETDPAAHPTLNMIFSVGTQPTAEPAEVLPDWLATLYYVDPAQGASAQSQWRASGAAIAMVERALTWRPEEFRGAYLMANAGLLYDPEQILEIARIRHIQAASTLENAAPTS